MHFKHTKT